ncbi:UNVERIFIED_CONTAM: hypothetical protein GTU68_014200 [Idotea baltica]|nr:hypothetical protein [Idotea baltica]
MGWAISWFEKKLNSGTLRLAKGIAVISILVLLAFMLGKIIHWLPDFGVLELLITTILLAHKSLIKHVSDVSNSVRDSLEMGRKSVSRIVGRDTTKLDESDVTRAAIESAAENFSDAVFAPVFWYFILGLPGLLVYKMVNTADSMIGHRNEQFLDFGFGAAKLDDLLNYIPARLCGAFMCLVHRSRDSFDIMMTDADLHSSPNAGWPEAAMAGILDITLSGPRVYYGNKVSDDAFINPRGRRELVADDIDAAVGVLNRSWVGLTGIIAILVFFIWLL